MKNKLLLFFLSALFISLSFSSFGEMKQSKTNTNPKKIIKYTPPWTPIRINLFPTAWAWPNYYNVYGFNLGISNSINEQFEVDGIDLALFISLTETVNGIQLSLYNISKYSNGLQIAMANEIDYFNGLQFGVFYNIAERLDGCQLTSIINYASKSSGVQIALINYAENQSDLLQFGLINYLENGFLPWFPIINFSY